MDDVVVISVVRDWAMYEKCLGKNPNVQNCRLMPIDNREKNERITVCYNRALEELKGEMPRWLVFCHEDFQPLENLVDVLSRANRELFYGPIGGRLEQRRPWLLGGIWPGVFAGVVEMSEKDGSREETFGTAVPANRRVDTVDCQCLIVHSSLVEKYHLRFDERLSFDLYVEDFCLGAKLAYGIETAIQPFRCRHYSRGTVLPRFFEQKSYLDAKYPTAEAFCCVGYTIGGGRTPVRRLQKRLRRFLDKKMPWLVQLVLRMSNF